MRLVCLVTTLLMCSSIAQAQVYETRLANGNIAFSDRAAQPFVTSKTGHVASHKLALSDLPGDWQAVSSDGQTTSLTLDRDGTFKVDQRSDSTPSRLYMCGEWNGSKEALSLTVKAYKRMLANGETEQAADQYQSSAPILSARRDRIILVLEGEQLVFDRS